MDFIFEINELGYKVARKISPRSFSILSARFSERRLAVINTFVQRLAHGRALTLHWEDGVTWVLRMDQGVGYWRQRRGGSERFPFDIGTDLQLKRLRTANLIVEGESSGHPTYWYCGHG